MMSNWFGSILLIVVIFTSYVHGGDYGWKYDGSDNNDKILLRDVEVITLKDGYYTNGRRSAGVKQLQCKKGCYDFTPKVVQCYNRGFDGYDVQWECKAEMPKNLKFGEITVSCEGYAHPNDPYVLRGSCGLEYTLEKTGMGEGSYSYNEKYYSNKNSEGASGATTFFTILFLLALVFIIYVACIDNGSRDRRTSGGYPGASAPPPPGFRSDYYPSSSNTFGDGFGGCNSDSFYTRPSTNRNNGSGFWTGAATGGLLGYMFGRSGSDSTTYHRRTGYSDSAWSGSTTTRSSSPSSSTHTSSGFGGTSRR